MAELETVQELNREPMGMDRSNLLIAIHSPLGSESLAATIEKIAHACPLLSSSCHPILALPGDKAIEEPAKLVEIYPNDPAARLLRYMHYPQPAIDPGTIPWLATTAAYGAIATMADKLKVRACTILGSDLNSNRESLTAEKLVLLLNPAMEGSFDLVMPIYSTQAFDGLVNKSILYPLTRTLYGHRVRNPLGNEFQMSSKLFSALSTSGLRESARQQGRLPWPATIAASLNLKICQIQLGNRGPSSADGIELSDALAQLVGPLFLDMEDNAAHWQRVRGSHEVPTFGSSDTSAETGTTVDVRHMVEAFQLGVRNLRELWALILPPVTLLELTKLSRMTPDEFHMEDSLWTRIVYDFALVHRLRNIRRAHLFGALTPLYLGWVASYAVEINRNGIATAQERVEQLARTYESEKPYLLSRWRWPDRFHP